MLAATMDRACPRLCLFILLVAHAGCSSKSKAAPDTATPTGTAAPMRAGDLDARERELSEYEAQLRALGLSPEGSAGSRDDTADGGEAQTSADPTPAEATTSKRSDDRCGRICALAEAICDIETNVCDLAREHPDEPRYDEVCTRARADCELASSSCKECE